MCGVIVVWYWQRVRSGKQCEKGSWKQTKNYVGPENGHAKLPTESDRLLCQIAVFRLLPELLMVICCCFFPMISQYTHYVLFAKQLLQESDSTLKRKMCLPCDWPYCPAYPFVLVAVTWWSVEFGYSPITLPARPLRYTLPVGHHGRL